MRNKKTYLKHDSQFHEKYETYIEMAWIVKRKKSWTCVWNCQKRDLANKMQNAKFNCVFRFFGHFHSRKTGFLWKSQKNNVIDDTDRRRVRRNMNCCDGAERVLRHRHGTRRDEGVYRWLKHTLRSYVWDMLGRWEVASAENGAVFPLVSDLGGNTATDKPTKAAGMVSCECACSWQA